MKLLAQSLSLIFNPIFFFLLIPYVIVYKQTNNSLYALKWEIFSALFIFIGLLLVVVGRVKKVFSDFDLSNKEERSRFYVYLVYIAISYLLVSLFFKGVYFSISIIAFGILLSVVVFSFVNRYVKASIHMASACAFILTISILDKSLTTFWLTFWILPIIAWSRLYLKRHTMVEIITGSVLGVTITAFTFFIGKLLYNT